MDKEYVEDTVTGESSCNEFRIFDEESGQANFTKLIFNIYKH